jgi:antitoxin MazE
MKTTTKVKMWGNSLAIRVPKSIAQELGLSSDSQLEILSNGRTATLKPVAAKPLSLAGMLKGVTPQNIHQETDWGKPVGKEVW